VQKTHNITDKKRLLWCELINPYNFLKLSMCFTIRHGKRLGETLKLRRLSRVSGSSRSRLGLVSDKILNVSVLSRFRLRRSRAHPWCDV